MDRHWGHQRIVMQYRGRSARKPVASRADQVQPIAVFDRQDKPAPDILVKKNRPTAIPGACNCQAIITKFGIPFIFAYQGNAAFVADKAGDKGRLVPTGST